MNSPFSGVRAARRLAQISMLSGLLAVLHVGAQAATVYVSPTGSDTNTGTLASPFASVMRAQTAANEGDTVLIRGGTYATFAIAATDTNYNYVHRLSKNNLTYAAYPGETPVFNFASIPTNLRVCDFHVTGTNVVIRGFEITGTPVGTQKQSECFRIEGSTASCDFYDCVAHDNAANGFYFVTGCTGSCTRCDSYNNIGPTADNIGNTDGFGAHANGVVFRYCRSWHNSDDGFDCLTSVGANTFDHCWAYSMTAGGDSNGFKIGGYASGAVPATVPVHTVMYCLSANNGSHGFYANHQPGQAATWTHNTAYNNAAGNFDMLERTLQPVPTDVGTAANDIPGYREVLHYNIAYVRALTVDDATPAENETNNSWTLPGVTAAASDFKSLDATQMILPRAQGLMPFLTFMHLTNGSPLTGLGCFDPAPAAPAAVSATWISSGRIDLSWSAVPGATSYNVKRATTSGGPYTIVAARVTAPVYSDTGNLSATTYYYVVSAMNDVAFDDSANSPEAGAIQGPSSIIGNVIPDTGRLSGDAITNATALTLSGSTGNTANALAAGSTVTVSRAGVGVIGTTTADANGLWSFDYSGTVLGEGSYSFTAFAANNGFTGLESAPFAVVIDTTPPAAPVISSASGSPLVFTGTAEANSIVAISRIGVGVVGSVTADLTGHWTYNSSITLAATSASFTATAADVAGNVSAPSATLAFDTNIAIPVIAAISSDNGIFNSDALTNDTTLVLSGTSGQGVTVNLIRRDLGTVGTTVADNTGHWSFDYSGTTLTNGSYLFNATATVGAASSLFSADYTVTIDTTAPVVASINRQSPTFATVTGSIAAVVFRVTLSKPVFNVTTASFALSTTGNAAGTIASVSATSGTSFDVTVNSLNGAGDLRLDLSSSNGLSDAAGNAVAGFAAGQAYTRAAVSLGSGIWTQVASGGLWSNEANWQDLVIADGAANSANFSTLNLTANNTVQLDSPRTINSLTFADTVTATAASWVVGNNGNAANTLTLAGTTPTITVTALGTNANVTLNPLLSGTNGLTKAGAGPLVLTAANPLTGPLNVTAGALRLPAGSSLVNNATVEIVGGTSTLSVEGGSFGTNGVTNLRINTSGAPVLTVSSGSASFDGGINLVGGDAAVLQVSGGTFSTSDINVARNIGTTITFTTGLIFSGGLSTVGTMEIGSGNSYGTLSVEGGTLNTTGPITVGNQVTSGRGGALRVTSGNFSVADTAFGLILSKVNGTNANNVVPATFSGGTSTLGKITLGYDSNVILGSATVTISGGTVYLGSGGIVKNATSGMTTTVTLSSGTLGAAANWATSHNLAISGAATVKSADATNAPFDITLSGVLSGAGAVTKTGGGVLKLSGVNTRTGALTINAGTVSVGTIANGGTASNLGQAALAATNLVINGGTLQYTGAATSHNRLFTLGASGATLDASGTGPLNFNSTTSLSVANTGDRTLTLTGNNSDANTLTPAIVNPSSGATAVLKNGSGLWILAGTNTFTGAATVDAGTLSVNGSIAAGGTFAVNAGATLSGTGTINRSVTLNQGGFISPAGVTTGTLTASALIWNQGGKLLADLGTTKDTLAITGALTKGSDGAGAYQIVVTPGAGFAIGTYTLATFGSTTFTGADFTVSGLGSNTGTVQVVGNSLVLTVAQSPFSTWAAASGLPVGQRGPADDPDGDGANNLLEFATGLDPTVAGSAGGASGVITIGSDRYPTLTFQRRQLLGDVTLEVRVSANLDFSSTLGVVELSAVDHGDGTDTVVMRSAVSLAVQPRQFFRITAAQP